MFSLFPSKIQRQEEIFRNCKLLNELPHCLNNDYITQQLYHYFQLLYNKQPLPFTLLKKKSKFGDGVFFKSNNNHLDNNNKFILKKGNLICIYPGTCYEINDPIFFSSFKNSFINQRNDFSRIDGKDCGISKYIYLSLCKRDYIYLKDKSIIQQADNSWLNFKDIHDDCNDGLTNNNIKENVQKNEEKRRLIKNPLAIGHYINSPVNNNNLKSNVMYFEYNFLQKDWPLHLRQFIPNISYNNLSNNENLITKSIVLLALEDLESEDGNLELLANYLNVN
ncbi:hypothetical protein ABK040_004991 [Willaertia magna]